MVVDERRMIVGYLITWLAMPLIGIGNAVMRELTYEKYVSELLADQIWTVTGIIPCASHASSRASSLRVDSET